MKHDIGKKKAMIELNKKNADKNFILEELKETECDDDEGQYTNDELTVARAIKNLNLGMKLH